VHDVIQALIDECTEVLGPVENTFVCGDDYPCIGHKPDRQDSAKVSLHPLYIMPDCFEYHPVAMEGSSAHTSAKLAEYMHCCCMSSQS